MFCFLVDLTIFVCTLYFSKFEFWKARERYRFHRIFTCVHGYHPYKIAAKFQPVLDNLQYSIKALKCREFDQNEQYSLARLANTAFLTEYLLLTDSWEDCCCQSSVTHHLQSLQMCHLEMVNSQWTSITTNIPDKLSERSSLSKEDACVESSIVVWCVKWKEKLLVFFILWPRDLNFNV